MDWREMTPNQQIFVQEIAKMELAGKVNKTAAARTAGYAHPASDAGRQLKKAKVLNAICLYKAELAEEAAAEDAEVRERSIVDKVWVQDTIAGIARDVYAKTQDRLKALDMLCKILGLYEQHEEVDNVIRVEIGEAKDWAV